MSAFIPSAWGFLFDHPHVLWMVEAGGGGCTLLPLLHWLEIINFIPLAQLAAFYFGLKPLIAVSSYESGNFLLGRFSENAMLADLECFSVLSSMGMSSNTKCMRGINKLHEIRISAFCAMHYSEYVDLQCIHSQIVS